jgi:hypothetical protein
MRSAAARMEAAGGAEGQAEAKPPRRRGSGHGHRENLGERDKGKPARRSLSTGRAQTRPGHPLTLARPEPGLSHRLPAVRMGR